MQQTSYNKALEYALATLSNELPDDLTYHNDHHTMEEVIPAARLLAQASGLGEQETCLIEIAAAFHDLGYLYDDQEHERRGAQLAREVLPGFGFSRNEVEIISRLILATRLPAQPTTLLEEILADADLSVLGNEDYFQRNEDLRQELAARGRLTTLDEWYEIQLRFMEEHAFFTPAAEELYGEGKRGNIRELKRRLGRQEQP